MTSGIDIENNRILRMDYDSFALLCGGLITLFIGTLIVLWLVAKFMWSLDKSPPQLPTTDME